MSADARQRALLIDLDNCPRQLDALPASLAGYRRIIACYGGVEPKVALGLVPLLASAIQEKRLEILGTKRPGKNAADFVLTFWAGRLLAEMPSETEFHFLSSDRDLDHAVDLLRAAGRDAKRLDGASTLPVDPRREAPGADDLESFRAQLSPERSRPRKRLTLLRSIEAHFRDKKKTPVDAAAVLTALLREHIVDIDGEDHVTYPDDDIPF